MSDDPFADPEICQAVLMDYHRHPRCAGACESPTHTGEAVNPACGDIVKLGFEVADGVIRQARASGAGCAVSQAAASLLAERLEGIPLTEAAGVLAALERLLSGDPVTCGDTAMLGNLAALRLIIGNPGRVRCASAAGQAADRAGIRAVGG